MNDLTEHRDWLERLAARLVADPERAEDLVQETWLAAVRVPPGPLRSPRAWLGAVLRKLALQKAREEGRRSRREHEVALASTGAAEHEVEQQLRIARTIVRELFEVREPYRAALRMRYLEDLSPPDIAHRLGVPLRTVHSRLSRGLALLRRRLERTRADGRWLLLPWPLTALRRRAATLPGRALLAAGAVAVAGGALLVHRHWTSAPPPARAALATRAPDVAGPHLSDPPGGRRLLAPAAPASEDQAPPGPTRVLTGRVEDLDGRVVAGIGVFFQDDDVGTGSIDLMRIAARSLGPADAVTDENGAFELALDSEAHGMVFAADPERTSVLGRVVDPLLPDEPGRALVVVRKTRLTGRLVDARGRPVEGAELRFLPPLGFGIDIDADRGGWAFFLPCSETDERGRFALDDVYGTSGCSVDVWIGGGSAKTFALEGAGPWDLALVLDSSPAAVVGRVETPEGEPLADALVQCSWAWTRSGPDGGFRLLLGDVPATSPLTALVPERPQALVRPTGAVDGRPSFGPFIRLRVEPGPAPAIAGRVLDPSGRPCPGAEVVLLEPVPIGPGRAGVYAEDFLATGELRARPHTATTDGDGRFRLPALAGRTYRVLAHLPETLRAVEAQGVRPGEEELVLAFSDDGDLAPVAGRLVSAEGEPLAEVRVTGFHAPPMSVIPFPSERERREGPSAVTDAEGRFRLPPVALEGVGLAFHGSGLYAGSVRVPTVSREELVVTAADAARLLLLLGSLPARETGFRLALPDGSLTSFYSAAGRPYDRRLRREGGFDALGRSDVLVVPDLACAVVLYREGREVVRVPIELSTGELNVVEL